MTAFEFQNQIVSLSDFINYFALRYTKNQDDAADLAQETMLKALSNYDKFKTNTNLKGWVRTLMRNIFINGYRRTSMRVVQYDSDSFIVQQGQTDFYSPENKLSLKEIQNSINSLSDEYREPFEMHFKGFKYHEIAESMHIPIGTVKSRIHQARTILSAKFK